MIRLDNLENNQKRISHKRHHESFKKDFLSKQKKIDKKNNKIEDEAEEKFDQKRREV
jgi:hypothetical protein